jgi:hypothetical protein
MSLENLAKLAESLPNITRLNLKNNTVSMMVKQYCISSELLLCRVNSRVVKLRRWSVFMESTKKATMTEVCWNGNIFSTPLYTFSAAKP